MKCLPLAVSLIAFVLSIGPSVSIGQTTEITSDDFQAYLRNSNAVTKTISYRINATVEMGDTPNSNWRPYSSLVDENVFPDRSHITYITPDKREFIRVGKSVYGKNADGTWSRTFSEIGNVVTGPSSPRMIGSGDQITSFYLSQSDSQYEGKAIVIKVVSRVKDDALEADKKTVYHTYWFDGRGVLYRYENVGFNGSNWVHRTETYEYVSNIEIETPLPIK
jgi:hypothetical protein